jgi:hypothetical protein
MVNTKYIVKINLKIRIEYSSEKALTIRHNFSGVVGIAP